MVFAGASAFAETANTEKTRKMAIRVKDKRRFASPTVL
jgi:hypothetical protein